MIRLRLTDRADFLIIIVPQKRLILTTPFHVVVALILPALQPQELLDSGASAQVSRNRQDHIGIYSSNNTKVVAS